MQYAGKVHPKSRFYELNLDFYIHNYPYIQVGDQFLNLTVSHLKATSGAVVHTQSHIDDVAPVIPRHKLGAADWAALDQHTQLAVCMAAG